MASCHDFRGAAEIAWTLDQMALFAHLAGAIESRHFNLHYDEIRGDDVRGLLEAANSHAASLPSDGRAGYWTTLRNSVMDTVTGESPGEERRAQTGRDQ